MRYMALQGSEQIHRLLQNKECGVSCHQQKTGGKKKNNFIKAFIYYKVTIFFKALNRSHSGIGPCFFEKDVSKMRNYDFFSD